MIVTAIVAKSKNNVIGYKNQIPWYLPADLKYFKKTTLGHHIIMGRKCFESIGRPLPKRTNIVLTKNPFYVATGIIAAHSLEEALETALHNGEEEVFIIGGGVIYELSKPFWDRLYVTQVDAEIVGDIFFPEIEPEDWTLSWEEFHDKDEKNEYNYVFQRYERKRFKKGEAAF